MIKRTSIIVLALLLLAVAFFMVTEEVEAAPREYGCENYGCLYEHWPTHYSRSTDGDWPKYGVAHQLLPDGPDGRSFVRVQWPEGYDPNRRSMWDRVAQCESTGRWHIATGNGFYGGLQFTRSTWLAYGGGQFAQYAHHALPEQQIAIAENVLREGYGRHGPQGRGAWPHCGRSLAYN